MVWALLGLTMTWPPNGKAPLLSKFMVQAWLPVVVSMPLGWLPAKKPVGLAGVPLMLLSWEMARPKPFRSVQELLLPGFNVQTPPSLPKTNWVPLALGPAAAMAWKSAAGALPLPSLVMLVHAPPVLV